MNPFATLRNTILICTILIHGAVSAQQILTNQDLIQMAELDMGEAIILSSIDNSNNDFDGSTPALLQMKKAGLSDVVNTEVTRGGGAAMATFLGSHDVDRLPDVVPDARARRALRVAQFLMPGGNPTSATALGGSFPNLTFPVGATLAASGSCTVSFVARAATQAME